MGTRQEGEAAVEGRSDRSNVVSLDRPSGAWRIAMCREKLDVRGQLSGAYVFDRACRRLQDLCARGADVGSLLVLALPTSWMVNNTATSPVLQSWLRPPCRGAWHGLLQALDGIDTRTWSRASEATREEIATHVDLLTDDDNPQRQGIAAVSKVLAQLVPDLVPLMDDAVLHFAIDAVPMPTRADRPSATASHFVPMLDWFAEAVESQRSTLGALASEIEPPGMSAAQVLDRLLWMESWGWRLFGRGKGSWWWVARDVDAREPEQVIVRLDACPHGNATSGERIALEAFEDAILRARAEQVLSDAWG